MRADYTRIPLFLFALLLAMTLSEAAFAQDAGNSIGSLIARAGNQMWRPLVMLLTTGAALTGLILMASGLWRLIDAGTGRGDSPVKDSLLRVSGGAFLFALPDTLGLGLVSIWGSGAGGRTAEGGSAGGTTACLAEAAGGGFPLSCVLGNFANNVVPAFMPVCFGLMFVWGMWLIASGVHQAATMGSPQARGQGNKWLWRIGFGTLACNISYVFDIIGRTLGYSQTTIGVNSWAQNGSGLLAYVPPTDFAVAAELGNIISYIFAILMMLGALAMWKGIAMLRAHSEGGGERGSYGSGLTHVFGGVALANAKMTTCFVLSTFLGQGLGFC